MEQSQVITQEINRPSHYGSKSGRDVIDWCEDFGIMENAYVFNIFKYLVRAGKKDNNSELQDAMKARVYLNRYIEKLERDAELCECINPTKNLNVKPKDWDNADNIPPRIIGLHPQN